MSAISHNIKLLRKDIPSLVRLVVVSKHQPSESILDAYNSGERVFGENRVQELLEKQEALPKDIEWHMIGHLQTNKVKFIAPFVSLIHAVDSLKLLQEINRQALKNSRTINCLLQFHVAQEESKHGFKDIKKVNDLLNSEEYKALENINISGIMGMATNTISTSQVRNEFKMLKSYFDVLNQQHFSSNKNFKEISMGMSNDYPIAIKEEATIIRVGSKIFNHV